MKLNYKMERPDLVVGHMKRPSKREQAYPYILGCVVAAIIILTAIKECM